MHRFWGFWGAKPGGGGVTWRKMCRIITSVKHTSLFPLAALVAAVLLAAAPAHALSFTVTVTDLNPRGFYYSRATGVFGTTQVGYGSGPSFGNSSHAFLWNGTAASAVDLNPAGVTNSEALGIYGTMQVGDGSGPSFGSTYGSANTHAFLWNGTAASAVDLNAFLPSGFNTISQALGVDSNGNIVGYGNGHSGLHAFLWQIVPAPEPSPALALAVGSLGVGALALRAKKRTA